MMLMYALEYRDRRFILAFACGCLLSSAYAFLAGIWPFGVVVSYGPRSPSTATGKRVSLDPRSGDGQRRQRQGNRAGGAVWVHAGYTLTTRKLPGTLETRLCRAFSA